MCGRFVVASSPTLLAERFHVDEVAVEGHEPDYNVAPRADVLCVRERADGAGRRRVLSRLRWGLVPTWAHDPSIGDRMINARAETVAAKAGFRTSLQRRRCIVPADGFYEWRRVAPPPGGSRPGREPMFIHRRDGEPLAFAGLWSVWRVPDELAETLGDGDGWLRSCAIVTTEANALVAPIHDRMPVVLPEAAWDAWLAPGVADDEEQGALRRLLVPPPDDGLESYPVSSRVNRATENDPGLVDRVEDPADRRLRLC